MTFLETVFAILTNEDPTAAYALFAKESTADEFLQVSVILVQLTIGLEKLGDA